MYIYRHGYKQVHAEVWTGIKAMVIQNSQVELVQKEGGWVVLYNGTRVGSLAPTIKATIPQGKELLGYTGTYKARTVQ
jgi:hypothetical protein